MAPVTRDHGRGPVRWVLLPGIVGSVHEWDRLGSPGPDHSARAVALGAGPSLAALAAAVLPALPPGRVHLVGASLGGLVAVALAAAHPERVAGVVTIGSLPAPAALPGPLALAGAVAPRLPRRLWGPLYRRHLARELRGEGVPAPLVAALVAAAPGPRLWAARLAAVRRWGLPVALSVPVVALTGRESRWARAPGPPPGPPVDGRGVWVAGGHRPHLGAPGALRAELVQVAENMDRRSRLG